MRSNPAESAGAENFDLLLLPPTFFSVLRQRQKAALLRPPRRQTEELIPIGIAKGKQLQAGLRCRCSMAHAAQCAYIR